MWEGERGQQADGDRRSSLKIFSQCLIYKLSVLFLLFDMFCSPVLVLFEAALESIEDK